MSDSELPPQSDAEEALSSLTDGVTPDVAEVVGEFMAEAAHHNEVEAEAIAEEQETATGAVLQAVELTDGHLPYIAFENVFKSFGDFKVLEDVSFGVNAGETLCILGRSGVGKSVSLQIIMGFLKPDSGTVLVAGQDITGLSERQMQAVRRKVTMVFQNGALFDSITVGENVAFPLRERGDMGGRADPADLQRHAGDGGCGWRGRSFAQRPVHRDEALGSHRAGTCRATCRGPV